MCPPLLKWCLWLFWIWLWFMRVNSAGIMVGIPWCRKSSGSSCSSSWECPAVETTLGGSFSLGFFYVKSDWPRQLVLTCCTSFSWFVQALIHLESIQPTQNQIRYIDSWVEKFIDPSPDNPGVASIAEREELSSIFLEVMFRYFCFRLFSENRL